MAIRNSEDIHNELFNLPAPEATGPAAPLPTAGEILSNSLTESPIVEVGREIKQFGLQRGLDRILGLEEANPNFDAIDYVESLGRLDAAKSVVFAQNPEEVNLILSNLEREQEVQKIFEEGGGLGVVSAMASGLLSPTTLIPGSFAIKALRTGKVLSGSVGTAGAASTAATIDEVALHRVQELRTVEESAINITAAAVLGGTLGGGMAKLNKASGAAAKAQIKEILKEHPSVEIGLTEKGAEFRRSAGAAETDVSDTELAGLNSTLTKILTGPEFLRSPVIRGLTSESDLVREVTQNLYDHPFITKGDIRGRGVQSVESELEADGGLIQAMSFFKKQFMEVQGLKGDDFAGFIRARAKAKSGKGMTLDEFSSEVSKAMRRGDKHDVPQIEATAKRLRTEMDKRVKRLQELELLDPNLKVKTAESYLARMYNIDKITTEAPKFKRIIRNYFNRENPRMDGDELDALTDKTYDNIVGMGDDSLQLMAMAKHMSEGRSKTFTKQRKFMIPDEEIEEFLVNDITQTFPLYVRQADHLIAHQDLLNRLGFESRADLLKALQGEITSKINKVGEGTPEAVKLTKQFKKDAQLVNNMLDDILGIYGRASNTPVNKFFRVLRKYTVTTLLGAVTLSSLPDMMMNVFKHGMGRAGKSYFDSIANFKSLKLETDQLKDFGVALELEENQLLRRLTDPDYSLHGQSSMIEDYADEVVQVFGKASLLTYWNNFHKRIAAHTSMSRTIRALQDAQKGTISAKEKTRLAQLGINPEHYDRLLNQFKRFGGKQDGSFIANPRDWDDVEMKKLFGTAIRSEVDSTILTPSRGDLPFAARQNEFLKTIFQFKSFAFAATNRILLSGLQRRDIEALQGIIGLIGLGAISGMIKNQIRGKESSTEPVDLIREGMFRSGVWGYFMENLLAGGASMAGTTASSRFAGRNIHGMIFGPNANLIEDTASNIITLRKVVTGEDTTKSDRKKLLKAIPFNNLFYIRSLLEDVFDVQEDDE